MINSHPGDEVVKKEINNLKKVLSKHERQEEVNRKRSIPKSVKDRIGEFKSRLAWLLLEIGEYQEALEIYRSLSWQKYGEEKYIGTTRALTDLKEYTEAGKLLVKGLKRFPDSSPLLVARGLLNFRLGDSCEALRDFNRAVQLTPDNSYALYDKALALNDLGYNLEASEILSRLVKEYPDEPEYRLELGFTMLELRHPDDAAMNYRKTLEMGYESPSVYGGLCCAYVEMGMKADALEIASEGLRKFPDEHPGLYENLGEAYNGMGWADEARDVVKKGIGKFPDDEKLKRLLQDIEDEDNKKGMKGKLQMTGLYLFLSLLLKKLSKYRAQSITKKIAGGLHTFLTILS